MLVWTDWPLDFLFYRRWFFLSFKLPGTQNVTDDQTQLIHVCSAKWAILCISHLAQCLAVCPPPSQASMGTLTEAGLWSLLLLLLWEESAGAAVQRGASRKWHPGVNWVKVLWKALAVGQTSGSCEVRTKPTWSVGQVSTLTHVPWGRGCGSWELSM